MDSAYLFTLNPFRYDIGTRIEEQHSIYIIGLSFGIAN